MQLAPHLHRIGNDIVAAYLIVTDEGVTVIDAGLAGHYAELTTELDGLGKTVADIRGIILTHGDSDHIGFAERIRRERGVPIRVHEADAALARGEVPNPARGFGTVRLGPVVSFLLWSARHGMFRLPPIAEVVAFGDGATLDVPGAPRVILVPGHTPGSAALVFPRHDAVFVGDAFATYSVTTGVEGPQVAPFTADRDTAIASLHRLDGLAARLLLPGHGQPWTGGAAEAVRRVRASASPG